MMWEALEAKVIEFIDTLTAWDLAGGILVPVLAFRFTNWAKGVHKRVYRRKPHRYLLDVLNFILVLGGSFLLFWFSHEPLESAAAAVLTAGFSGAIVKGFFMATEQRAPMLNRALGGEDVYVEDKTALHTVMNAVAGTKVKQDRRNEIVTTVSEDRRS